MNNVIELSTRSSGWAQVAAEVRAEMARAAVTQTQLSAATGIPQSTLNRRLKARAERDSFAINELEKIAKALGVSVKKFLAVIEESPDPEGPDTGAVARPKGFEPLTFWLGAKPRLTCINGGGDAGAGQQDAA